MVEMRWRDDWKREGLGIEMRRWKTKNDEKEKHKNQKRVKSNIKTFVKRRTRINVELEKHDITSHRSAAMCVPRVMRIFIKGVGGAAEERVVVVDGMPLNNDGHSNTRSLYSTVL